MTSFILNVSCDGEDEEGFAEYEAEVYSDAGELYSSGYGLTASDAAASAVAALTDEQCQ